MKTKIKTISPDQNIIEHESGLKTGFVEGFKNSFAKNCKSCIYSDETYNTCRKIPCISIPDDSRIGYYVKLL